MSLTTLNERKKTENKIDSEGEFMSWTKREHRPGTAKGRTKKQQKKREKETWNNKMVKYCQPPWVPVTTWHFGGSRTFWLSLRSWKDAGRIRCAHRFPVVWVTSRCNSASDHERSLKQLESESCKSGDPGSEASISLHFPQMFVRC